MGTDWDVAKAITYAANHSADVISMSLGGDDSKVMEDACSYANKGAILFAASGNEKLFCYKEVRNRLRDTAKDMGKEGKDDYYGYGLVNASPA